MDAVSFKNKFIKKFGENNHTIQLYFAPGRVNIIGEHTDYNGGFVLPCALSFGTYLAIRKSDKKELSFASENFDLTKTLDLNQIQKQENNAWMNYPLGILDQFQKAGKKIEKGFDFLYAGNIPPASGLSSSASIELVTAFALNDLLSIAFNKEELVQLSLKCEHDFIAVNCGIMDQFSVAMGKQGHAILLNCKTLDYKLIPFLLGDYKLVIINSNKSRGLAESAYNERVKECKEAVEDISQVLKSEDLGELSLEEFRKVEHLIRHPRVKKRAFHVINENYRVKESAKALKSGDLKTLGKLMNASHKSLRDYYEVTGKELDTLAETAWDMEGVLGARMTGAGFGGCTANIVHKDHIENFKQIISTTYFEKTGLEASFYLPEIGDGVRRIP